MNENLKKYINNYQNKKICVIGDIMVDKFIWGQAKRISPEAPVPVVLASEETCVPGGAANTANNIAALGGEVYLVGVIGDDNMGKKISDIFRQRKIAGAGVIASEEMKTTEKTRVIANNQQVVRVDRENGYKIGPTDEKRIFHYVEKNIKNWDGLVISDYNKGLLNENLFKKIIDLCNKHNRYLVGDVRPSNSKFCKNILLICPNLEEAREISGEDKIEDMCKSINNKLGCNVLITQGEDGMTLYHNNKMRHFLTKAKEVFDVAGAGDTVVASVILSLVSGATFEEAAVIANYSAGIVVGKVGTSVVRPEELLNVL